MKSNFAKEQKERVLKSIQRTKELKEKGLCFSCGENKATTHDQLFTPICQECRDYLEYGIKK